jgi:hypothetical protein
MLKTIKRLEILGRNDLRCRWARDPRRLIASAAPPKVGDTIEQETDRGNVSIWTITKVRSIRGNYMCNVKPFTVEHRKKPDEPYVSYHGRILTISRIRQVWNLISISPKQLSYREICEEIGIARTNTSYITAIIRYLVDSGYIEVGKTKEGKSKYRAITVKMPLVTIGEGATIREERR